MSWPSQLPLTILFSCVVHSLNLLCSPSHQPRTPQVALSSQGASPKFEGLGCPYPTSRCVPGCPQPQTCLSFWGLRLCDQQVMACALTPIYQGSSGEVAWPSSRPEARRLELTQHLCQSYLTYVTALLRTSVLGKVG